jgi:lysophospholipase L1-like esterase
MAAPVARILIASDSTAANYGAIGLSADGLGHGAEVLAGSPRRGGEPGARRPLDQDLHRGGPVGRLLEKLQPGDTVMIAFGHNDADRVKIVRFTDPKGAYTDNLTRFVADVRAKGGQPVLMTPIAKHVFVGDQVQETHGAYALGGAGRGQGHRRAADRPGRRHDGRPAGAGRGGVARLLPDLHAAGRRRPVIPNGISDTTHINEGGARLAASLVGRATGVPEAAGVGLCASGVDRRAADPRRTALPGAVRLLEPFIPTESRDPSRVGLSLLDVET